MNKKDINPQRQEKLKVGYNNTKIWRMKNREKVTVLAEHGKMNPKTCREGSA